MGWLWVALVSAHIVLERESINGYRYVRVVSHILLSVSEGCSQNNRH